MSIKISNNRVDIFRVHNVLVLQGDVLAGSVAVALHWALRAGSAINSPAATHELEQLPAPVSASMLAAITTKRAAAQAFAKKGRSTLTPDLLEELGAALWSLETDSVA